MSHSGNAAARRLRSLPSQPPGGSGDNNTGKAREQLYNSSVFKYKCVGRLQLDSEKKGSPGVCHGFQSRIERVANLVPDTREASIKRFLDAASDLGSYVDSEDSNADQKLNQIYTSRTMIYKDDSSFNNMVANNENSNIRAPKPSPFPEEDLIDKTQWSCYGSTQVHYLVLEPVATTKIRNIPNRRRSSALDLNLPPELEEMQRVADEMMDRMLEQLHGFDDKVGQGRNNDSNSINKKGSQHSNNDDNKQDTNKENSEDKDKINEKVGKGVDNVYTQEHQVVTKIGTISSKGGKIAAITPENIGLSVRKIDSAVGHFTVADIGSIRICLETSSSLMGDSEGDKNQNESAARKQQNNGVDKGTQPTMNETGDKNKPRSTNTVDLKKFYNFTVKVAQKIEQNCHEIKEAMADDFPGRTYDFGNKVVQRINKTTDQTFTYMGKIFDSWWKNW